MDELEWSDSLEFGKYKGKDLHTIWFEDPEYVIWLWMDTDIEFAPDVLRTLETY